jgi:hypothetical protein
MMNEMKTENQKPLEFEKHRFLIDIFADEDPNITLKKSAQCGGSVCFIFKSAHACKYRRENVIYVLPTQNIVKDFVSPKVDPLLQGNPVIAQSITKDSVTLKQIGDRFLYFKGSSSEREAIAISGDTLILDELDRMIDMQVVNTYDSRLQASDNPRRWRLSNPTGIGFGIDALYNDSDQRHWFVKCTYCTWEWFISFEPHEDNRHYVDQDTKQFVCGKCHHVITDNQRQNGQWVQKFPSRETHGYWLSQVMVPYVSAKRIMEQKEESNEQFFKNFVLGEAFTPSDLVVNRETILRATAPSTIQPINVAMGVDQKAAELHVVAMTPQGVFYHNRLKSWEEVEHLMLTWQATVVVDAMPYPTMPKIMAEKYPDKFYMAYFKESRTMDILTWKQNVVFADRTRLLDTVAQEISDAKLLFRERPNQLEDYIAEWQNLYRTTEEQLDGRTKSTWLKRENRESDFPFATAYARIALSRVLAQGTGTLVEPSFGGSMTMGDTVIGASAGSDSLGDMVAETLARFDQ